MEADEPTNPFQKGGATMEDFFESLPEWVHMIISIIIVLIFTWYALNA